MTQEEKQLLLVDLCARAQYETKCAVFHHDTIWKDDETVFYVAGANVITFEGYERNECYMYWQIKPYLRPLSSMTEEERLDFNKHFEGYFQLFNGYILTDSRKWDKNESVFVSEESCCRLLDWLNSHHFDYRRLIEKGLALEATEGMYKTE